jgi:hypothetical protein
MSNIFEEASRKKLRFAFSGNISVEDLWDLSVDKLDSLYMILAKKVNDNDGESLIKRAKSKTDDSLRMDLVKHVFNVKSEEAEAKKNLANKKMELNRLKSILAEKQDESLKNKTPEELVAMIASLEG